MKNVMIAGIALMMLAGSLPATAYHFEGSGNEEPLLHRYTVGLTDLEVFCESYGLTDPVNSAPAAHDGTNGLCFMSSNVGTCTPGVPSTTDPAPVDNCSFTVRAGPADNGAGTAATGYTLFKLLQTPLLPDVTGTRTGSVFYTANPGGNSGGLFAGADTGGACVENRYSDLGGASGGHVAAFDPLVVLFLAPLPTPPVVLLNSLPGDSGTYSDGATTVTPSALAPAALPHPTACNGGALTVDVSGLGVFFVGALGNSGLFIF